MAGFAYGALAALGLSICLSYLLTSLNIKVTCWLEAGDSGVFLQTYLGYVTHTFCENEMAKDEQFTHSFVRNSCIILAFSGILVHRMKQYDEHDSWREDFSDELDDSMQEDEVRFD